jgi:cell division septation protein DedD
MPPRRAQQGGVRRGRLAVLLLAVAAILCLTFLVGFLVGRQSVRNPQRDISVEKEKRPAQPKGGGLKEREVERPPRLQDKLTFYHTLTEPASAPRTPPPKAPAAAAAAPPAGQQPGQLPSPGPQPAMAQPRFPGSGEGGSEALASAAPKPGEPPRTDDGSSWTVQVAAYRSRELAIALQRALASAGYDVHVNEVTGQDGAVRYRVRVGQYPTRADADRISERLRGEQALSPLVVPR